VDTSAYFALANPQDASHREVRQTLEQIVTRRYGIFTTNFILAETHALLLTRVHRTVALQILTEIEESATVVVRVSARDERRAREILRQYTDKNFSLTDATSFAVMERLGIVYAFTLDHHFAQYGFAIASNATIN
jgi:predicted nucleic acid-binding protein